MSLPDPALGLDPLAPLSPVLKGEGDGIPREDLTFSRGILSSLAAKVATEFELGNFCLKMVYSELPRRRDEFAEPFEPD